MKLFISWSGERSEALAKNLHEWLQLVLHFLEPWLSKSDIQAGERWSVEVAKGLEECNFGILCITKENVHSDWILFEAGALAKSMQDGRVIPLLLDLDFKDISGPLAQFQSKKVDVAGIKELVVSLNRAWSSPIPDAQLDTLFELVWPRLEAGVAAIPAGAVPAKQSRPQGEILEELVSSIRNVEVRLRETFDEEPFVRRGRRSKHNSMMMMEMAHRVGDGPSDPIRFLMLAGLLREDAPWLYELAMETYRLMRDGNYEAARDVHRKLDTRKNRVDEPGDAVIWG